MLITAPIVMRGLVHLHGAVAHALLVDETPALRQRVSALTESRTAAGEAEAQTLRRLERDLHDGPQQRLVRLGMDISAAQRRMGDDPTQARALLDEAFQQSQDALAEIRTLSRGIAPPILAEQGSAGGHHRAGRPWLAYRPRWMWSRSSSPTPRRTPPTSWSPKRWPTWRSTAGPGMLGRGARGRRPGADQRERRRHGRGLGREGPRSGRTDRPAPRGRRHADRVLSAGRPDPADRHPPAQLNGIHDILAPVRVVVADDSVLLREGLVRLLTEAGARWSRRSGMPQAFSRRRIEHRPDVAVVDIRMPPRMPTTACRRRWKPARGAAGTGGLDAVGLYRALVRRRPALRRPRWGRLSTQGPGGLAGHPGRGPPIHRGRRHRAGSRSRRPAAWSPAVPTPLPR